MSSPTTSKRHSMASSFSAGLDRITDRVDGWIDVLSDYVNPILVKETRQAIKSQQFVLWFMLLLAACWLLTIGGVAVLGPGAFYGAGGARLFQWYFFAMSVPLLLVAPFSAFRSLMVEQEENTHDLLMVSALSPYQIINGKLGSVLVQMVVYLSVLAPCMAFSYLLRGIDLQTLFLWPAYCVLASLGLSTIGLLLATLVRNRYGQVVASVGLVGGLILAVSAMNTMLAEFIGRPAIYLGQQEFWIFNRCLLTFYVTTLLLVYLLAVSRIMFASGNRSTAIRVGMLLQQACFLGWTAYVLIETRGNLDEFAQFVVVCGTLYWYVAGILMTTENAQLSQRVRRRLPQSRLTRLTTLWFTPGPGTGYCFAVANAGTIALLTTIGIGWAATRTGGPLLSFNNVHQYLFVFLVPAYLMIYLGIGRLMIFGLRRVGEVRIVSGILLHALIALGGNSIPLLTRWGVATNRIAEAYSYDMALSPTWVLATVADEQLTDPQLVVLVLIVSGVAACVLLVNLFFTAQELQQTRMATPTRVIEDEAEQHASEQQPISPWDDAEPVKA